MIPPLSTRALREALASRRRDDAAARWTASFDPRTYDAVGRRDIPKASPRPR